jgi:hypothetical protein
MLDSGKHIELIELIEPFELIASKTQRPLQETLLRRKNPLNILNLLNLLNKTPKNATSLSGDIANKDGLIQPIQLYPAYLSYLALLSYFRTSNQVDNERTFRT